MRAGTPAILSKSSLNSTPFESSVQFIFMHPINLPKKFRWGIRLFRPAYSTNIKWFFLSLARKGCINCTFFYLAKRYFLKREYSSVSGENYTLGTQSFQCKRKTAFSRTQKTSALNSTKELANTSKFNSFGPPNGSSLARLLLIPVSIVKRSHLFLMGSFFKSAFSNA